MYDDRDPPPVMETFFGEGLGKIEGLAKIRSDAFNEEPGVRRHHHHGRQWGFAGDKKDSALEMQSAYKEKDTSKGPHIVQL